MHDKPSTGERTVASQETRQAIYLAAVGVFFGLSLLKFGNPVIFDAQVGQPQNAGEFIYQPWPVAWGYTALAGLMVVALLLRKTGEKHYPRAIAALPLIWLAWQFLAATQTIDATLTGQTIWHFTACVVCFYIGLLCVGPLGSLVPLWIILLLAFVITLRSGLAQHFGGLEQTRKYFDSEILPHMENPSQEFLLKLKSNRIFGTLFYPNTFAGAILLFLPFSWAAIIELGKGRSWWSRIAVGSVISLTALACLYWSGSKSGWLIALVLGVMLVMRGVTQRQVRGIAISAMLVLGLGGFFFAYAKFFQRGATSVSARMDYWRAAVQITEKHPLFGTGPGTFSIPYQKIKRPEAEMARLAHNDYVQQASDSGLIGFIAFSGMILSILIYLYRYRTQTIAHFLLWLGLVGVSLQGLSEFNLYVPALAWTEFFLFGLLLATPPESSRQNRNISPKNTA